MKKAGNALANILLLAFCLLYMFPIYIIFVNSFKDRAELYENVLALPKSFSPQYYAAAISKMNFLGAFKNTFVVTLVSVLIIVVLTAMTAWMLVRTQSRFSRFLYGFLIVTMLIPFQTVMMPLMQEMNLLSKATGLSFKDSLGGLVFMYIGFGAGMGVFLFHGFIKSSVPLSLEEAATIDGANRFKQFTHITLPLIKGVFKTNLTFWSIHTITFFVWSKMFSPVDSEESTIAPVVYMMNIVFGSKGVTTRDAGAGAAVGVTLALFVLLVFFVFNRLIREEKIEY